MTSTKDVRTRIAPSPTGFFHIGNMRTALYNYALAKKNNGSFVIRVEDTDRDRHVEEAIDVVLNVLKEYGLNYDEGPKKGGDYGPYIQSQNLKEHQDAAHRLIEEGKAYRCFCTQERLEEVREKQREMGYAATRYDKHCANLSEDEIKTHLEADDPYVIRFRVPEDEIVEFSDAILGDISVETKDIDDFVILRSNGYPIYQFAVVMDDNKMKISHILRGIDIFSSTPKQVLLYKALGYEMPVFAHLPNLKEKGANKKMSKRNGDVFADGFLDSGYLPEAMLNFLMFLGWNPGTEKEIYSLSDFVEDFTLDRVHTTDLVAFDRDKLIWMNGHYIRSLSVEELYARIVAWSKRAGVELISEGFDKEYVLSVVALIQEKMKKLDEYNEMVGYFFGDVELNDMVIADIEKFSKGVGGEIVSRYSELLSEVGVGDWNVEHLDKICHEALEKFDYKAKQAFMTLRLVITASSATPPLFDVMAVLGKEKVLERLSRLVS